MRTFRRFRAGLAQTDAARLPVFFLAMASPFKKSLGAAERKRADVARVVFFFQAEDGIRDYKVTGVQTCALPILAKATKETPKLSKNPLEQQDFRLPRCDTQSQPRGKSHSLRCTDLIHVRKPRVCIFQISNAPSESTIYNKIHAAAHCHRKSVRLVFRG